MSKTVERLTLEPRERPWGGDGIPAYGLHTLPGQRIGEWWVRAPRVPLLVKLLDAREDLSIQLHPDDATARDLNLGPSGKTEAWYVLDAKPGARILLGLHEGASVRALLDAARRGDDVSPMLAQVTPVKGQLIFIPPGTIHAVGADCTLLEVQQDCDVTLRIFDWNRTPKRPLHLDEAQVVLERAANNAMGLGPCVMLTRSLTCPYFDIEILHARDEARFDIEHDEIWFVATGRATLIGADATVTLAAGEFACVARGPLLVRPDGATEFVRTTTPRRAARA